MGDSLFETVKSTKNDDSDKYGYSFDNRCGIGFDECTRTLMPWDGFSETIIFVVDNNSSAYVNNIKRDILILSIGPQGISQEGKKLFVLHELGNKMQLGVWALWQSLYGFRGTRG